MKSDVNELGVGIICFPGMEPQMESWFKHLHSIEVEPQTSWFKESPQSDSFTFDTAFASFLKTLPQPKIFHGVGFPVGGTLTPERKFYDALNAHIDFLKPVYLSEHLSFNKFTNSENSIRQINFLLPPLQNQNGVETAIAAIKKYKDNVSLPFAFETGTNYLKPRRGEMADGEFVACVAEESDSYILLDIHNLVANALNGRQRVRDFIRQLPLERVIEVHLAGGHYFKGHYLDAHSGVSSTELLALASEIVGQLPCLKSIIFEMLPDYLMDKDSVESVRMQLVEMNKIWDGRGKTSRRRKTVLFRKSTPDEHITSEMWENCLGGVINNCEDNTTLAQELMSDPGVEIIKDLVFEFRASMVVSGLKMTCRLMKAFIGRDAFNKILLTYCRSNESQLFGYDASMSFARHLETLDLSIPYLAKVIEFELSACASYVENEPRTVSFPFDPFPLFDALVNNEIPKVEESKNVSFNVEIVPDRTDADGKSLTKFKPVLHN